MKFIENGKIDRDSCKGFQRGGSYGFYGIDLVEEYRNFPVRILRIERGDFVHPNDVGHQIAGKVVAARISHLLKENSKTRKIISKE